MGMSRRKADVDSNHRPVIHQLVTLDRWLVSLVASPFRLPEQNNRLGPSHLPKTPPVNSITLVMKFQYRDFRGSQTFRP